MLTCAAGENFLLALRLKNLCKKTVFLKTTKIETVNGFMNNIGSFEIYIVIDDVYALYLDYRFWGYNYNFTKNYVKIRKKMFY